MSQCAVWEPNVIMRIGILLYKCLAIMRVKIGNQLAMKCSQRGVVSERNNDVKTFVGIEAVS